MQAQMYSLREFPIELRETFELPGDPYSEDSENEKAGKEYLRGLGVFFYRDEEHGEGIIIDPEDGNETPIDERVGFMAWKCSCDLDEDNLDVTDWPKPTRKHIKKHGDAKAWMEWNVVKTIMEFNETRVVTA